MCCWVLIYFGIETTNRCNVQRGKSFFGGCASVGWGAQPRHWGAGRIQHFAALSFGGAVVDVHLVLGEHLDEFGVVLDGSFDQRS